MKESRLRALLSQVIRRVTPDPSERKRVAETIRLVTTRIKTEARKSDLKVDVVEVGSVAKDTWIKGDKDIDIFILFPKNTDRETLEKTGLALARRVAGRNYVEAYAEHPYIEARIEGYVVDIVPSVGVQQPDEAATAVDRTPFHKQFIASRMNERLCRETRILKQFMKGVGVYGAEIRVRGFSGYLCELLVIYYKSFKKVISAAGKWSAGHTIDIQHHYKDIQQARQVFDRDPLVVIDPVDRRRNVASAVTLDHLAELAAASRAFLVHSDIAFFYPPPTAAATKKGVMRELAARGTSLIAIASSCPKLVPDILWGQCYKTLRGLETLLQRYGFETWHSDVWSDEKSTVAFLFELSTSRLTRAMVRLGPSVFRGEDSDRFLAKHLATDAAVAGPWIRGGRWVIQLNRHCNNASTLLKEKWREARAGSYITDQFAQRVRILEDSGVVLASDDEGYRRFLTEFLVRKPAWLS